MLNEPSSIDPTEAIRQWAENHSAPDTKLLAFSGGTQLTPREMLAEVESGSALGKELRQAMAKTMNEKPKT